MDDPLNGACVLVVENDPVIADLICIALEQAGAVVVGPLATAKAALQQVASTSPDVALLDVQLDDGDVFPVAAALRERQTPFVFFTGALQLIPAGFRDAPALPKPVPPSVLIETLARIVNGLR